MPCGSMQCMAKSQPNILIYPNTETSHKFFESEAIPVSVGKAFYRSVKEAACNVCFSEASKLHFINLYLWNVCKNLFAAFI